MLIEAMGTLKVRSSGEGGGFTSYPFADCAVSGQWRIRYSEGVHCSALTMCYYKEMRCCQTVALHEEIGAVITEIEKAELLAATNLGLVLVKAFFT